MPLTGGQKTNLAQLYADAVTLRASLSLADPEQNAVKIFLERFEKIQDRVKDSKNK